MGFRHEQLAHDTSFTLHWVWIYECQGQDCKPFIFRGRLFFQIKALVVENVFHANFTAGHYTQKKLCALSLSKGRAMLDLSFPCCPRSFKFELKSANTFFCCGMLRVWGTTTTIHSFRKQLSKSKNELSRQSYFTQYLAELRGNDS
jgi:hypothetical protein